MRLGLCGSEDVSISYTIYSIYSIYSCVYPCRKNNPKLRGRGTHIPSHMVTAHIHQKTLDHSCTQPLSHYSISRTPAHTFTFNYTNSDAPMQEGTHKHPPACIQVFWYLSVYVDARVRARFLKTIHKS